MGREIDEVVTAAAVAHRIDPDALRAVVEVESAGQAFESGRPVILYEPHVAYRVSTKSQALLLEEAGLAYPRWGAKPYPRTQAERWRQYDECARLVGEDVAIQACSWGVGQVLGENWRGLGYASPREFRAEMDTLAGQVEAVVRFIVGDPRLVKAIEARDWPTVARIYNGPGYARNRYDQKMAAAYTRLRSGYRPAPRPEPSPVATPEPPALEKPRGLWALFAALIAWITRNSKQEAPK